MRITTEWIATNFARFNKEYFGDELPIPRFLIVDTIKFFGQSGARGWHTDHPRFFLKINSHFRRTEYRYKCTMLHEMIHLFFQSKGEWDEGHGEKFVKMAMRFRDIGWDISIPNK